MATNKQIAEHLDCSPEWISRLKSQNILPSAPGKPMNMDRSRIAYINYLRSKARMTSNTDDGTIIEFVGNVKAKLLNLPSKLAHQVIGLENYAEAEELLMEEVHEALTELSKADFSEPDEVGLGRNGKDVPTTKAATG